MIDDESYDDEINNSFIRNSDGMEFLQFKKLTLPQPSHDNDWIALLQ